MRDAVTRLVWLDGPRKGQANANGVVHNAPTKRQLLLLAGEDITEPLPPPGGEEIWIDFWQLHKSRINYGYGPCPLAWAEIKAWADLTRIRLLPWEIRAIKEMDHAYLEAWAALEKNDEQPALHSEAATPGAHDISAAFKAALGGYVRDKQQREGHGSGFIKNTT